MHKNSTEQSLKNMHMKVMVIILLALEIITVRL